MPAEDTAGCFGLHKVEWLESLVGIEDGRLICHFRAPDAEAVRVALRNNGTEFDAVWAGTVHGAKDFSAGNFIVEYRFAKPATRDAEELLETLGEDCLASHQFKLNRAIISRDQTRVICLCQPLGEFVPYNSRTWPFLHVSAQY